MSSIGEMNIVSINQPAYLAWLGYYQRIGVSNTHIILDHVQFEKNSFTNRNKIRCSNGWCWLTIPLKTKGRFGNLQINNMETTNNLWQKKHWATIMQNYSKAPFFRKYAFLFEKIYLENNIGFFDFIDKINRIFIEQFDLKANILYSSNMNPEKTKSDLVLELCLKTKADIYLSGALGRDYLDMDSFDANGIKVVFQDYIHPVYKQTYSGFEPYMASIDLLFNHGSKSREILFKNQKDIYENISYSCASRR